MCTANDAMLVTTVNTFEKQKDRNEKGLSMGYYDKSNQVKLPDWAVSDLDIETINNMTTEVFEKLTYTERCAVHRINPQKYDELAHGSKPATATSHTTKDDVPTFSAEQWARHVEAVFDRIHMNDHVSE